MPKPSRPEPLAVPVEEAARLLGISRTTAYRLIGDGTIRTVRLGGCVRVARHEIDRLLGTPTPPTGQTFGPGFPGGGPIA